MNNERRSIYFAFQGLLTAVLLLITILQADDARGTRLALLIALLLPPLVVLRVAPPRMLGRWWFQTSFFLGDAAIATTALYWKGALPESYFIYVLIIFGTALTRNFKQSIAVGLATSLLFLAVSWSSSVPRDSIFWLRFQLLIIATILLSTLSHDAHKAQLDQERRYQQRLIHAERLATLGRVAGEVAHRIKGPLTTIRVNAEVLSHKFAKSRDAFEQLAEIQDEVDHCKLILKGLLDLGRIEEMEFAPLDFREVIRFALRSVETQMKRRSMRVALAGLDAPLPVVGDQSLLQEAVASLLQNAIEAGDEGGLVRLSVHRLRSGPIQLIVEDSGRGIAEEDLDRLFQPFFTTKGTEGSGLGLSAAVRILQKHNGTLEAHSDGLGLGAKFTMTIPAAARAV